MIPLKLTFEGLYSYQEKQIIDFEQLTSAGIFGIFGETGSGKSAILEAISFALYGMTERLNQRDERNYNMLNLKSDKCEIDFEFLNYENEKYRVFRYFKRNSKKYNEVKTTGVTFYKFEDEEWKPTITPIEEILNITYSNFKRTIIIPQGQFKEFLELGPTDRTNMLEEIFQLERFDLQRQTNSLQKDTKENLDKIEGELKAYEAVSKEKSDELKETFEKEKIVLETEKNNFKKADETYTELKKVKESFENLQKEKLKFDEMNSKKKQFEDLKTKVDQFEKVSRILSPLFKEEKELNNNIISKNRELENDKKLFLEISNNLKEQEKILEQTTPFYEILNERRKEEVEYDFVIKVRENIEKSEQIDKKIISKNAELETVVKQCDLILADIKIKEAETTDKKKDIIAPSVLLGVNKWFLDNRRLTETIEKLTTKINGDAKTITQLSEKLTEIGVTTENYKDHFSEKAKELKSKIENAEKIEKELSIQQKLAEYSNALHNGEPCPLCGSEHHPNIVQVQNVSEQLQNINTEIKNLKDLEIKIQTDFNKIITIATNVENIKKQKETNEKELSELKTELTKLNESFIWSDFSKDNYQHFEEKQKASEKLTKEVDEIVKNIADNRKKLEDLQKVKELGIKELDALKLAKNEAFTAININKQNLSTLKMEDFDDLSIDEIKTKGIKLKNGNDKIERMHKEATTKISDLKPQLSAKEATINALTKQIEEFNLKLKEIKGKIILECKNLDIQQDKALEIIARNIDIDLERRKIQNFTVELETLKNKISDLEKELSKVEFSTEKYQLAEKEFKEKELILNNINEKIIILKKEIETTEKQLIKKEELQKEQSILGNRYDNLATILKLFNGKGFVNYISSIYLRQLCEQANVRFQRITRNRLSLQVNDKNDFEIIDYLNGGKTRSVKTLSGGQSFQASLSLALALAESVQAKSKTENNFFFIDEGFGTQDINSVNLIFETLRNLNKENKIVGIISHVDELKERIPASLIVTKNDETGSSVRQTF